jgi:5'-nucleotidase
VKIGVFEFCPRRPDLVVSGINGGLNAGINVLYSGTVAAAIEGAFFGITSIAISLEYDEHARFDRAAVMARSVIEQILAQRNSINQLYNLNFPTAAMYQPKGIRVVPMGVARYGEHFIKRTDPKGRTYYWATGDPAPGDEGHPTDLSVLSEGYASLTPLHFNLTKAAMLQAMEGWSLKLPSITDDSQPLPRAKN